MRAIAIVGAALVASLLSSTARAGTPVVETYTDKRPEHADELLRPMFEVFNDRGCTTGQQLTDALSSESRAGVAASQIDVENLAAIVDSGINLLNDGDYEHAAEKLLRAKAIAEQSSALLARDDSRRGVALRAYVGLAMVFQRMSAALSRKGDRTGAARAMARADQVMDDAVRSFPGMEPDRVRHGTEVVEWWRRVRDRQLAAPTGTLVVDPGDDGVNVFIQESYAGRGITRKELAPGSYRVYTERPEATGRVHTVEVRSGETKRLVIDWDFDAALFTGSAVGFSFDSPITHRERRRVYAGRVATTLGEKYAIIVGLSSNSDGHYAFGLAVDRVGTVVVSGEVSLDVPNPDEALRNFAVLLTTGTTTGVPDKAKHVPGVSPLDLEADPLPWADHPSVSASSPPHRHSTATVIAAGTSTAGAAAALGVGLWWMKIDGQVNTRDGSFPTTKWNGVGAVSAGVVLGGVSGYLWARSGVEPPRSLRRWRWVVGGASVAALAGGAALIAIDDPGYSFYNGTAELNATMRPTLVRGGILATVGAVGLGTYLWLSQSSSPPAHDAITVRPLVNISPESTSIGLMGSF